ncbi:hypothetical protein AAE478_008465 [Parahypoxylon ruwenzoriense]
MKRRQPATENLELIQLKSQLIVLRTYFVWCPAPTAPIFWRFEVYTEILGCVPGCEKHPESILSYWVVEGVEVAVIFLGVVGMALSRREPALRGVLGAATEVLVSASISQFRLARPSSENPVAPEAAALLTETLEKADDLGQVSTFHSSTSSRFFRDFADFINGIRKSHRTRPNRYDVGNRWPAGRRTKKITNENEIGSYLTSCSSSDTSNDVNVNEPRVSQTEN